MLRLRLHRIWAVCTKKCQKTLKTLGISRVKRQSYHKLTIIISGKTSDMYKADACKMQASAFFRCRKITDANVLNGFFKRLGTILKMKTERFTAVKRSVFV